MSTKIQWTDETWNPIHGCTPISEGCRNCYARRMARRLQGRCGYPSAPDYFNVTLRPDRLDQPLKWRKPRRVFVVSMGDLFHEDVPDEFIGDVWQVMQDCSQHTFQVLTKRPVRMMQWVNDYWNPAQNEMLNVWLGVTAENQATADERIPLLLQTPAAVRFVSAEPLLGMMNLENYLGIWTDGIVDGRHQKFVVGRPLTPNLFTALAKPARATLYENQLDWVITGGETGPGARPMHPDWARGLRDQCQRISEVAYFHKHNGEHITEAQYMSETSSRLIPMRLMKHPGFVRVGSKRAGRQLDGRTWDETPGATK